MVKIRKPGGQGPRFRPPLARRRTGQTDYRQRLHMLQARKPRLVVRPSNRAITVQFIDFAPTGDVVRATATSRDLTPFGWDESGANTPAAYLTGLLAGKRAAQAGIKEAILDIGLRPSTPGGRAFAVLQGVVDAGVHVPHGKDVVPKQDRLRGEHIEGAPAKFDATKTKIQQGGI